MQTVIIVGKNEALRDQLYNTMVSDGMDRLVMFDKEKFTRDDFTSLCDRSFVITILDGDKPKGFVWVNNYIGEAAQIHFCWFREYQKNIHQDGLDIFTFLDNNIKHSIYMGLTPVAYRHVFKTMKRWGFEIVGTIPKALWMERRKKFVDAYFSLRKPFSGEY